MTKVNRIITIFTLIFIVLTFSACEKKWEEPEFAPPVYNGKKPNKKIIDIKNQHINLGAYKLDSICKYNETFLVRAVVVSTDEGGNYYKSLVIQDETGGIELQLDQVGLYNYYPVGQEIILDCRGLIVGDYHRMYQVGWEYQKYSVGRINSLHIDKYIHKDGLPSPKNLPEPLLSHEIDFLSNRDICKLVKLENCRFAEASWGKPFSYNEFSTEHAVYIPGNRRIDTVIVRTSNYARFRSLPVPSGTGTLTGILTIYNNSYQLMIRTIDDIQFGEHTSEEMLKEFIFDAQSLESGGWSSFPEETWQFRTFMGDAFMMHAFNESNIQMDDWLVSPSIEINRTSDAVLRLFHKNAAQGLQSFYQIYYTTAVDAPFNPTDYMPLPPISGFFDEFAYSNDLSLNAIPANRFRIAVRYNNNGGQRSSEWLIKRIEILKK